MIARGDDQKTVAKSLGVTEQMVSYTVNSDLGKQKLKVLRGEADAHTIDIMAELANLGPLAVGVYEDILTSPGSKDETRLRAAEGVLASQGVGRNSNVTVTHKMATGDELAEARQLARDRAISAGIIAPQKDIEDAIIISNDDE